MNASRSEYVVSRSAIFCRSLLAAAATGVALAWATTVVSAETITLKFATALTPTNPILTDIYDPWAKRIAEASGGELQIQVLPATFASTTQVWERTVSGVADMSIQILPTTGLPFARASVTTVPGLADDTTAGAVAMWRAFASGLTAEEFKDVHVMNVTPVP